jgi:hypothetical protein
MANDFSGWPWVIDTPGPGDMIVSGWTLARLRWVAPAGTGGETVLITDRTNREIWASVSPGENFVESDLFEKGQPLNGLRVPTLGTGKLYIYYILEGELRLP